jgi:ferrous iron transport protein A
MLMLCRELAMPLSSISEGQRVRVEGLPTHPVLQQRLISMGVRPGAEIEVLRRGKPGGILHLSCGFLEFMLRHEHAEQLNVALPTQP